MTEKKNNLFIVESPTKVKNISKYLEENFVVLSTKGHIKDLEKRVTTVASAGEDIGKALQQIQKSDGLETSQLDQIRKLIRKEVGRILFDIYKLRSAWTSR